MLWAAARGEPPGHPDDYHPLVLVALLGYAKTALEQIRREAEAAAWERPRVTGDPIVDEWERQIAAGEDPDFSLGKG